MKVEYITIDHWLYPQAVQQRIDCFFSEIENSDELINDSNESSGIHVVCLSEDDIVRGTGRLNIENSKGVISQMAIDFNHRREGIGKRVLLELISRCKVNDLKSIELNSRVTAIEFYKRYGFVVVGEQYASPKTGVLHNKMRLQIAKE